MPRPRQSPPNPQPGADPCDHAVAAWVHALRRKADATTLKNLPTLSDADAARVMALLRMDDPPGTTRTPPATASGFTG